MRTNLLAANAGLGAIWLVLLFIICFLAVHTLRVLKRGLEKDVTPVQPPPTEQTKPKPKTEKPPEPVYYIVEKKKKRPKSSYGEPKEIKFRNS